MQPIFLDKETCGFYGLPVLIQYAEGETAKPTLHDVWHVPVQDTLDLIHYFCYHEGGVIMFNSVFDWFHGNKLWNCFNLVENKHALPNIKEIAAIEEDARDGLCLLPQHTLDLFLHARKGPYQSTMERGDISIRRVPQAIAVQLANELEKRVKLNKIYFANRKDKYAPQWRVKPSKDYETKEQIPGFFDVTLEFAASSSLKALAVDALNINVDDVLKYTDVEIDPFYRPYEVGFAPFHEGARRWAKLKGEKCKAWPDVIEHHINHWRYNERAREYASLDIDYLQRLYPHFGRPEMDDDDSVLACKVAADRWKGFATDEAKLHQLLTETKEVIKTAPTAPRQVLAYLKEKMDDLEAKIIHNTNKNTIKEISRWVKLNDGYVCDKPETHNEHNQGLQCYEIHEAPTHRHPAAERASLVISARSAQKEVELYEKLLVAGRFHPSFKIIGTLSSRMAGADDLNPQGIKKTKPVRSSFLLAFPGEMLSGGDEKAFEVALAEAEYNDPKLRELLLSGKKVHAIFGEFLFPDMEYDEILATDGTSDDKYTTSKSGFFALIYGGDENTLHNRQGIPLSVGENAIEMFGQEFTGVASARKKVFYSFCSMSQPIPGGPVVWREPADYVESMLGFRRYFTLENKICKALYQLAKDPPEQWKHIPGKVKRRQDRLQTNSGAAQSALYGAAFGIQGANMRAAANHRIQSTGAQITKRVQRRANDLQPKGICPFVIRTLNIHDEINAAHDPELKDTIKERVITTNNSFLELVPMIKLDWKVGMADWSCK